MNSQFNSLSANRRSIYALGDNLSQTPEEIFENPKNERMKAFLSKVL